jgi:hypothetical protein
MSNDTQRHTEITMVNNKTLATFGDVPIFGYTLAILLGSYFALCFGLCLGKSSSVGSVIWNWLEYLSLWMQDPGRWGVHLFRFL